MPKYDPPAEPGYVAKSQTASLATLSDHLGISKASISRVLTGSPAARSIPAATQERILLAARQLKYRPNLLARSLRNGRSLTIGVVVPELSEGYSTLVLAGLERTLSDAGYAMMLITHHHRQEVISKMHHTFQERAVDGIVAVDTMLMPPVDLPMVTISCPDPHANVTNILLNHNRAAELALDHLYALGHRRIAIIKGQKFSSDTEPRWRSIKKAAARLGLPLPASLVVELSENLATDEPGFLATQRLLRSGEHFTALFAFNDISAFGAIRALQAADVKVPEHVSVVGFDDISLASYVQPTLTTVQQPLLQMGILAAETILRKIKEPENKVLNKPRVVVQPRLILRNSTAKRNLTGVLSVILICSPVCGLPPMRSLCSAFSGLPTPGTVNSPNTGLASQPLKVAASALSGE